MIFGEAFRTFIRALDCVSSPKVKLISWNVNPFNSTSGSDIPSICTKGDTFESVPIIIVWLIKDSLASNKNNDPITKFFLSKSIGP